MQIKLVSFEEVKGVTYDESNKFGKSIALRRISKKISGVRIKLGSYEEVRGVAYGESNKLEKSVHQHTSDYKTPTRQTQITLIYM